MIEKAVHAAQRGDLLRGRRIFRHLEFAAIFEPLHDRLHIDIGDILCVDLADGRADEFSGNRLRSLQLAFIFQFHFSGDRRNGGVNIGHARRNVGFAVSRRALLSIAGDGLHAGNGQALTDAGAAIDALVFTRKESDLLDDFADVVRGDELVARGSLRPGFLRGDGHAFFHGSGVMSADFAANSIFKRSDDFSARGVIFGIGSENDKDVERQANRVALNLNVAFLHDVEKPDLNLAGQVRQFVNGKNSAVGAGQQSVMHGEFVGKIAPSTRGFDGVHVADNVGDGHVGRGQFFDEAVFATKPGNRGVIALLGDKVAAGAADGMQRMVMNFASRDVRNLLLEEIDQSPKNTALRLPAEAEKDEIVPGQDRIRDLRQHRLLVSLNAGKQRFMRLEFSQQVATHLVLDATVRGPAGPCRATPFANRGCFCCCGFTRHMVPFLSECVWRMIAPV